MINLIVLNVYNTNNNEFTGSQPWILIKDTHFKLEHKVKKHCLVLDKES
jgi:hypothetical protein